MEVVMQWQQIREQHPDQWLLIEAIEAHSEPGMRILDDISVVDTFDDSAVAMRRYVALHEHAPQRELYVVHTDREELDIHERRWLGIRGVK
jgi:hypothetical protein